MRLNAWLDRKPKGAKPDDATTNRDDLLQMASMRNHDRRAASIDLLDRAAWDRRPESLDYLFERFERLASMRDVDGMIGQKRMTPTFIRDGAALFGWTLLPDEALAISALDAAQLFPGDGPADSEGDDGRD